MTLFWKADAFTLSRKFKPGLKCSVRRLGRLTVSPVFGLLPIRASRWTVEKPPKPCDVHPNNAIIVGAADKSPLLTPLYCAARLSNICAALWLNTDAGEGVWCTKFGRKIWWGFAAKLRSPPRLGCLSAIFSCLESAIFGQRRTHLK